MEQRRATKLKKGGGSDFEPLPFIIGGALLVVVLAFIFWPRPAPSQASEVPTAAPTTATTVPPATATLVISPIATYVDICEEHMKRGRYLECINTAEAGLAKPNLSEADRRILNGYIVSASLKDIESTIFDPLNRTQHQHLVDTYLSLRERARTTGVELEAPLQVAKEAHASSQFPLAKVAIEEALKDGLFDPKLDRDVTRLYVSTLYGTGEWYTKADKGSPLYQEGLRALVTSDRIADRYQTGQSESEALLEQLGYSDKAKWPAPLDVSLLR